MNKTIIKIKLFILSFLIVSSISAQEKMTKLSQSIKVDKDVTIDLNTSYANIVFDTWNKNTVEIEAYVEGEGMSNEELKKALEAWHVDVDASSSHVSIKTTGHRYNVWKHYDNHSDGHDHNVEIIMEELKHQLADIPDFNFDYNFNFEMPELPEMPEMPELPELPEGINKIHFDYEAYKKDGDAYLKEYTQKFESTFGEDYAKKMEEWGKKFGEEWGEKYGKDMEEWAKKFDSEWGEKFGKQMEEWGKRFAERMERKAERVEQQRERIEQQRERVARAHERQAKAREEVKVKREKIIKKREDLAKKRRVLVERIVDHESHSKVKKTIIIKMPKNSKLKVNVRHGELEFASTIDNLKADLSHTKFTAHSINGSSTSVNASYSPVYVEHWNLGELNLKYVEKAELNTVNNMVLNSNSSNITIDDLQGNAIIDGSIGDLKILKIDDTFTNLNIIIQNSDAVIVLPKVNHNLQYKGDRSHFSHPKNTSNEHVSSFSNNNLSSNKTIVVNAKYSNVSMQ